MTSRLTRATSESNATPELQQLSDELRGIASKLQSMENDARQVLLGLSPSIEALANAAAEKGRQLSEHTRDLAEEVEKDRIPDLETSLEVLDSHLELSQAPIEQLREALVDQADSQSLLDLEAVDEARRADMAIALADQAQALLRDSLEQLPEEKLTEAPSEQISDTLQLASQEQNLASRLLSQIAGAFQPPKTREPSVSQSEPDAGNAGSPIAENDAAQTEEDYKLAEQLAEFGSRSPEEMLKDLENELAQSEAMQFEMSQIARDAVNQAIDQMEKAGTEQHKTILDLEHSDTPTRVQKRLIQEELKHFVSFEYPLLNLLVNEIRWAAGAARATGEEATLKQIAQEFSQQRVSLSPVDNSSLAELRSQSTQLEQYLQTLHSKLEELLPKFEALLTTGIESNGAALNNRRREMKDRYRRVQQQMVRLHQQLVRSQQQRLKQADNDLTASLKRLKSVAGRGEPTNPQAKLQRRYADALTKFRNRLKADTDQAKERLQNVNTKSSLKL
ncbi:MAG: hypothetical protein AAF394_19530, partial [Planctomycetota bacterium]